RRRASGRLGALVPARPRARPAERAWTATTVEVTAPGEVHAGRDGEAALLVAPMRFAIRPLALRVRISARHPGASPSAQLSSLDPRRRTPVGPTRRGRP